MDLCGGHAGADQRPDQREPDGKHQHQGPRHSAAHRLGRGLFTVQDRLRIPAYFCRIAGDPDPGRDPRNRRWPDQGFPSTICCGAYRENLA